MTHDEIVAIEKELGLDKLGVSLHQVLEAMKEPGGDSDLKLEAALREEAGELAEEHQEPARNAPQVWFDDIGRYTV